MTQALRFFDELLAESTDISPRRQILDLVGQSAHEGRLRSKAAESQLGRELAIVC